MTVAQLSHTTTVAQLSPECGTIGSTMSGWFRPSNNDGFRSHRTVCRHMTGYGDYPGLVLEYLLSLARLPASYNTRYCILISAQEALQSSPFLRQGAGLERVT